MKKKDRLEKWKEEFTHDFEGFKEGTSILGKKTKSLTARKKRVFKLPNKKYKFGQNIIKW